MKKIIFAVVLALGLSACGVVAPDAGQEAVLVSKPMFFGHGGVQDTPVTTGRSYTAWTTDAIYVDVKPVQYNVPFEDLMTKDGIPMHFDAALVLQVTDSVKLYKNYGTDWYKNNIDTTFRNLVRQAVRKHGMNEVAIDTVAIETIDREVNAGLTTYLQKTGIPVKIVRTTVGKANPPDSVKNQRVETAQEEQRALTQTKVEAAEIARKKAEQARAEADKAYIAQMGLSPEQFVELDRNRTIRDACVGDGKNCTLVVGGTAIYSAGK